MPQVEVHVVFPGLRQRAVHLNCSARATDGRLARRGLGQSRGVPARRGRGRRVVEARRRGVGQTAGALQRHVVVRQRVLDALECADRLAELLP